MTWSSNALTRSTAIFLTQHEGYHHGWANAYVEHGFKEMAAGYSSALIRHVGHPLDVIGASIGAHMAYYIAIVRARVRTLLHFKSCSHESLFSLVESQSCCELTGSTKGKLIMFDPNPPPHVRGMSINFPSTNAGVGFSDHGKPLTDVDLRHAAHFLTDIFLNAPWWFNPDITEAVGPAERKSIRELLSDTCVPFGAQVCLVPREWSQQLTSP